MSMNDDVKQENSRRLVQARADYDERRGAAMEVLSQFYVNPRAALSNMQRYINKHSDEAFLAKVEKDHASFGGTRGHIGSGKALTLEGAQQRAIVKSLKDQVPRVLKDVLDADKRVLALERAVYGPPGDAALSRGKGGPGLTD